MKIINTTIGIIGSFLTLIHIKQIFPSHSLINYALNNFFSNINCEKFYKFAYIRFHRGYLLFAILNLVVSLFVNSISHDGSNQK